MSFYVCSGIQIMKTTDVDFRFPVLGFTKDLEIWGFQDRHRLTKCGPRTLKEGTQLGMELVDADGYRWMVLAVSRTGRAGSFLSIPFIFGLPQSRIELELEQVEAISIEGARQRACAALEVHAENYYDGGEPDAEFESLLESVKCAPSIADIYELLQPDTFESH